MITATRKNCTTNFIEKMQNSKSLVPIFKKINDLVTNMKLPKPQRGEKNLYYCLKLLKHLERHFFILDPLMDWFDVESRKIFH